MNLSETLEFWGTDEFNGELADALGQNRFDFDFEEYCTKGGWADRRSVEFIVHSSREKGSVIIADCMVDFQEVVPGACPDLPDYQDRKGAFTLTLDRETGEAETERDLEARFEPGEYY